MTVKTTVVTKDLKTMKKKFLALAMIAASLVSFDAMAQKPASENTVKTENIKEYRMKSGNRRAHMDPFAGLNLTDSQKAQLKELKAKRMADRKLQAKERRMEKTRNDSARMAIRRAAKKSYLEEVKAIIGPDRYVVFLENMYINGSVGNRPKAFKQGMRAGKERLSKGKSHKRMNGKDGRRHASDGKATAASRS